MTKKLEPASTGETTDAQFLRNALDRIDILERLVAGLVRQAGAHPPYVDLWRKNIIDWPDAKHPLSTDSQYLVDWGE
jgi:hypothetical protein